MRATLLSKVAGKWLGIVILTIALLGIVTTAQAQTVPQEPKILFIMTDDQDTASLKWMPKTQALLADEGTTFVNASFTFPLCCPSRASILRGQYAHNHGVTSNVPPEGGESEFREKGLDQSTFATWLKDAENTDYTTAFVGKYLNGYKGTYVPPGWDTWWGRTSRSGGVTFNHNGQMESYEALHDVMVAKKAEALTKSLAESEKPFLLWASFNSPHYPAAHEKRYTSRFKNLPMPKTEAFNEVDVSDKPGYISRRTSLSKNQQATIRDLYRDRVRSLQTVDNSVGKMVQELADAEELDNTYIVFWTDNGYHMGDHRLMPGKETPYTTDSAFPLTDLCGDC